MDEDLKYRLLDPAIALAYSLTPEPADETILSLYNWLLREFGLTEVDSLPSFGSDDEEEDEIDVVRVLH